MSPSAETLLAETAPPHPAPVNLWRLWFGVVAAPLVWLGQVLTDYLVTSLACFPAEAPQNAPLYAWSHTVSIAFDIAAIVVATGAAAVSYASWRGAESVGSKGGALNVFVERAHFMALWGLLFSCGFLAAILFETIADIAVPLCGG